MVPVNIDLPEGFLDEEENCGYKISKQMKEVWAVELDLLEQIKSICEKYGLKYYACGGTLLGAIRHNGFIPWDDDIDIAMLREDYEKLCSHSDEFKAPYELQFYGKTSGYFTGHAQLRNTNTTGVLSTSIGKNYEIPYNQGIFIDIFPLDAVPGDEVKKAEQIQKVKKLKRKALKIYRITDGYIKERASLKRKAAHCFFSLLPIFGSYDKLYRQYLAECQRYNDEETDYVNMISFMPENEKLRIKRENLCDIKEVPFEFSSIMVEENYDAVLKVQYGDYMTPVKGGCYHGGVIFDANVPFSEWLKNNEF